jgi:hypothetical protein
MSTDPRDWSFVRPDYWRFSENWNGFLDYLFGWREAFAEAAEKGYGLSIDCG